MTDKQFEKALAAAAIAGNRHLALKEKCDEEYFRRYGSNPHDADDDYWIDCVGGGCGAYNAPTAKEVECGALMCGLNRINK